MGCLQAVAHGALAHCGGHQLRRVELLLPAPGAPPQPRMPPLPHTVLTSALRHAFTGTLGVLAQVPECQSALQVCGVSAGGGASSHPLSPGAVHTYVQLLLQGFRI